MAKGAPDTTALWLRHCFGNTAGMARLWLRAGDSTKDYKGCRQKFVDMLKLGYELPETEGVTYQHLREMAALAQSGDWSNVETIKALYRRKYAITHEEYDERELFG